jgi:hypothetical protein
VIVAIHQPDFLPWLGFFDRWQRSDLHIILDDAQFLRRGWHHRDRIKVAGGTSWLTVPVVNKGRYGQLLCETQIDNSRPWRRKHLGLIRESYRRSPNFKSIYPGLEAIYCEEHATLVGFNLHLLAWAGACLGIQTPIVLASHLQVASRKTQRLVDLCAKVGSDTYLSGIGAKAYLDEALFAGSGIRVLWQEFQHPRYPQLHGPFEPNLSALDYLMADGHALS